MRRFALPMAVLVAAAAAAMPWPASAQQSGDTAEQETRLEQAQRAFAEGEEAYDEGHVEEALARFRRAYELSSRDAIRFNIAVCLQELGRAREAAREYDAVAESEDLPEEMRRRATELAAQVREQLGTLRVRGEPQDASVLVDGEPECTLPCRVELEPGTHEIEVRSDAGTEARTTADVVRGEVQTVVITPSAGPATEAGSAPTPEQAASSASATGPELEPERRGPGWMTWTGLALALAGGGATVGLGIHTENLGDDYQDDPSTSLRDEGLRYRRATNAALGIAVAGALLIAVDLAFFAFDERPPERATAGLPEIRF